MSADWLLGVFCRPPGARHSWTASYKYSKKYKDGLQLGDGEQKDQATGGPMRSGLYWENMQGRLIFREFRCLEPCESATLDKTYMAAENNAIYLVIFQFTVFSDLQQFAACTLGKTTNEDVKIFGQICTQYQRKALEFETRFKRFAGDSKKQGLIMSLYFPSLRTSRRHWDLFHCHL